MDFKRATMLLLASALGSASAAAQYAKESEQLRSLGDRGRNKDQTLDFRQLRFAYADSTSPKADTNANK